MYRYRTVAASPGNHDEDSQQTQTEISAVAKLRLNILGAYPDAKVTPLEQQQTRTNYLFGQPSDWQTDIANYLRVRYENVLENIDVEYYGVDGRLEYDFVIHPGGNPAKPGFPDCCLHSK